MLRCPMCHREVLGRPTQCEDCGYRFTRDDFEKAGEEPVYGEKKSGYGFLPIINGILGLLNILVLFLPMVEGYGMSYNLLGLLSETSRLGGMYASAGVSVVYAMLAVMFILELIFIIMSFCGVRASGGVGIPASLATLFVLGGIKSSLNSSTTTFYSTLMVIIPLVTFVLSIVVLVLCRKSK